MYQTFAVPSSYITDPDLIYYIFEVFGAYGLFIRYFVFQFHLQVLNRIEISTVTGPIEASDNLLLQENIHFER